MLTSVDTTSMTCGIYGIFDLEGKCLYVGQSREIEMRWKSHLKLLKSGRHRRKDFVAWFESSKADVSCMRFQIMEEMPEGCSEVELNQREVFWFEFASPRFYGKLPSTRETWSQSEETRKKISEGLKNTYSKRTDLKRDQVFELECERCGKSFSRKGTPTKICSPKCSSFRDKLTHEDKLELLEKSKTMSLRQMAPEYGVSYVTLHKVLKEFVEDNPV